mgnify:CR=1 FL=1
MSLASARLILVLATATWLMPSPAQAACSDPSGLCMEPVKGGKWEPDGSLSAKQLKAKRKGTGNLTVKVDDGRGSVFVDGRYAGTAPLADLSLGAGRHDLQVRDGAKILAEGIVTVPKGATVKVNVRHP